MTGNLSDFTQKARNTVSGVLKDYNPEIRIALGPASMTFKLNRIQESDEQEISER